MAESALVPDATNKFAVDLYKCLRNEASLSSGNLFYSPASLLVALSMTCYGARGKTAEEILKVLHLDSVRSEDLNSNTKRFLSTLNPASDSNTKLLIANKLFVEKSFKILESFKEGTREFYDAEVGLVDYITHTEKVKEEINQWVEQKTNGKIEDLIPSGMLNPDTRLALVNAIYFKGFWLQPFIKRETFPALFYLSASEKIQVPTMQQEADFKHSKSQELGCQILEMPYMDSVISMVILLPVEIDGLGRLEEKMTIDNLQTSLSTLDAARAVEVEVHLPKFKLSQQFDLSDMLSKMGAEEMFISGKADFTGICTAESLFVSKAIHKAFVEVNEEGTEAAAATAFSVAVDCARRMPVFHANHPFLFLIRHNKTGAILFMGRLIKPIES